MPRRFHVESVYPSHFVADDRNILFACKISQLNIEGFWIPCLVIVLLRCTVSYLRHYHTPRRVVSIILEDTF